MAPSSTPKRSALKAQLEISLLSLLLGFSFQAFGQAPQLYINEIMAYNATALADEAGQYDDWIELYNAGDTPIDLAGYFLSDRMENPKMYQIPAGPASQIPAHGFLLVWCDQDPFQGPLHANFKLSLQGESVGLFAPNRQLVDSMHFGLQAIDQSFGRLEDGSTECAALPFPSPSHPNATLTAVLPTASLQQMPRLSPNPSSHILQLSSGESFRIYNLSGQLVGHSNESGIADVSGLLAGFYIARNSKGVALRFEKR